MISPIILRIAQRYISRRLLQSVLFVLGVALGVAVVIAIDVANNSASRAFSLSTESVTGKATHQIFGGPSGLPTDVYTQLRVDLNLRDVAPVIEEFVRSDDVGSRSLHLLGVEPFAEPPFRDYLTEIDVLEGEAENALAALNSFITEPRTVLLSATTAATYGIETGDEIRLRPGDEFVTARVIGLLQPVDDLSEEALDDLLLTDIATAQELVGTPDTITRIDLILPDDYDLSQIEAILPPGATLTTPESRSGTIEQMTDAFELNLQALSLLALVVGVFLIYNTVTFSVVQRRPIIGILRSVGMTRSQIFALILSEGLLLGLIGTIIGLGLGIIFGRGAVSLVAQTISDLYFTVNVQRIAVEPFTLVKGAAIGMFASLVASLLPSFDATRTPPAGTMRRSDAEQGARKLVPYFTTAAVSLNVLGVIFLLLPTNSLAVSFTALFFIIVGSALFTPLFLVVMMRVLTPVTNRIFGVIGRMAPRSVSRSLSRTSIAVAALTVAVSVIVGVSVMISSFRLTVSDWLNITLGADIYISPPSITATGSGVDVDRDVETAVAGVDGVARVASGRGVNVLAPDYPDMPPVNLNTSTGEIVGAQRQFAWISVGRDNYWDALDDGKIMVSEPFALRRDITPENNELTLLTDRGEETFEIVGIYYDYSTDQGTVFMADSVYREYFDDPYITSLAVFVAEDADPQTVLEDIRTEALTGRDLLAQSNVSLREGVFEIFDRAFSITIALRLLATIVAFIGIFSALMSLQLEQLRQYGVMRAVGMTASQIWRYTLIQTGLMGIVAGVLALPVGLALAYVLIYVINVRSFGWTMQMNLQAQELIVAFLVAVVAAVAAGVYPAYSISRLVMVRALRSE